VRVGVNLLWLLPGDVGGSEDWVAGLLRELVERPAPGVEVIVFAPPAVLDAHPWLDGFRVVRAPGGTSRPRRVVAEATWLAMAGRRARVDVLHHPGGTIPVLRASPAMVTIHDLQPLAMPEHFSRRKLAYLRRRLQPSATRSTLVTGVSDFTRDDVVARLGVAPDRTAVTPPAVDPDPPVLDDPGIEKAHRLDRPWLLYPAITYAHKDHATVVRALAELPDHLLVLTGGAGPAEADLRRLAELLGVADRVRRTGRIPGNHLDALYRGAAALVFPSRFEAVGLPVLEAMARGCPVVAADATGLPAVVGDAGVLVPPGDPHAWVEAVRTLDGSLVARGHERVRGWAPAASAARLVEAWERACAS
jgi:alpha-1,3-rhamnosyl/mannosyltransferase